MPDWRVPTLGAIVTERGTAFRVWAPERSSVDLVIERPQGGAPASAEIRPLDSEEGGYWVGRFHDVGPGARYRYRLDGRPDQTFPDPASRSQPDGVHEASAVVDARTFDWRHDAWRAPALSDVVIYELHVGTFTADGTFRSAIDRLPYLADLGVTAIELMPVGDFPGARNWGYDGVAIFAPARCYGTPDDLRALVDAAHQHELAVYLDVVYNHLGPDGAYANAFSPYYFTDTHQTAWGAGVNFDGAHSPEVRRFFLENALHWVREYHVDGLRLDATHAMRDDSPVHFLAELTAVLRAHAPRRVLVVAEDHRNLARMLRPASDGGMGLDAVWADDFHHQVRVHTVGDREGYYADFTGTTDDLAATVRQGWFYTGQYSEHLQVPRGTNPETVYPPQFVICIQNHDQIGNRADGARLHHQVDAATYRATTALLLLAPETPLLFMGQEWAASSPFQFFTDHHGELGRLVTEGRRREFAAFAAFADPAARDAIPDPQAQATFARSRLEWAEIERDVHARTLALYRRLIAFRRDCRALRHASRETYRIRALDAHTVALSFSFPSTAGVAEHELSAGPADRTLHVVVRLTGAGAAPLPIDAGPPHVALTTEDAAFVEDGASVPIRWTCGRATAEVAANPGRTCEVRFGRPGAIVLVERD